MIEAVYTTLLDHAGRILWVSGYVSDRARLEVIGRTPWELAEEDSKNTVRESFAQVLLYGKASSEYLINVEFPSEPPCTFRVLLRRVATVPGVACVATASTVTSQVTLLSGREVEVLGQLAQGSEPQSIAKNLGLSVSTIHSHLTSCRRKLRLTNYTALVCFAAKHYTGG